MIAGHEEITSGDVILNNRNISLESPALRSTSMMFQNYALFPHLTVVDNAAYFGMGKQERHVKAMELLDSASLPRCGTATQTSYQVDNNKGGIGPRTDHQAKTVAT